MKLDRKWAAVGLFAAARLIGKCKKNALETAQIYGATAYLKGVGMVRDFFLYQIGILVCVILLIFGVISMEAAVLFYIPVDLPSKILLFFSMSALHVLIAGVSLGYFASSKRWLRQAARYNAWVEASLGEDFLN